MTLSPGTLVCRSTAVEKRCFKCLPSRSTTACFLQPHWTQRDRIEGHLTSNSATIPQQVHRHNNTLLQSHSALKQPSCTLAVPSTTAEQTLPFTLFNLSVARSFSGICFFFFTDNTNTRGDKVHDMCLLARVILSQPGFLRLARSFNSPAEGLLGGHPIVVLSSYYDRVLNYMLEQKWTIFSFVSLLVMRLLSNVPGKPTGN